MTIIRGKTAENERVSTDYLEIFLKKWPTKFFEEILPENFFVLFLSRPLPARHWETAFGVWPNLHHVG